MPAHWFMTLSVAAGSVELARLPCQQPSSKLDATGHSVSTKVETYQSGSWRRADFRADHGVSTKVDTYQSGAWRYQSARRPMLPSITRRSSLRLPPTSRV